jgi:phosphate transport system substrate-binding protein
MKLKSMIAAAALVVTSASTVALASVDPKLPGYKAASGVSGNVTSIGSDTLNNLMTLWSEEFNKFYPNVRIQVQGAGSSTAPPALIEGTSNMGPMSRAMRDSEIQEFEKRHGHKPYAVPVAIDMVAVYVNKDNPVKGLTLPEVDAIFSATRRCGHPSDITRWGQVGLTGAWANRDFTIYSRNAVSGTYGYFKQNALCDGDFRPTINEQPGSSAVVQGVSESLNGIGYSGIGYMTSGVRAVPLAREAGGAYAPATGEAAADGSYPLARFLYVYVNKAPNRPMDPATAQFIKMVLSKEGQEVVVRDGYVPLPEAEAAKHRKVLGLE